MEYEINLTPQAAEQIQQIAFYIAHTLKEPETAKRLIDLFLETIGSLSFMPTRHPLTEEEPWHSYGVRKMIVKNFFAYYLIDEKIPKSVRHRRDLRAARPAYRSFGAHLKQKSPRKPFIRLISVIFILLYSFILGCLPSFSLR